MEPSEDTGYYYYTPENPWVPPQRPEGYDELGQEMAPDARVWREYVEETEKADKELVEGWNKTLDVILIFAALFSAISTAFVLESSKDLKQDYAQTSARTLYLMSQTLSAVATRYPINSSVSALEAPDPDLFAPPASAVAVNTLWFLSLSLSVAVSLIAIIAKDWCSHFMSGRVGPMLKQGRLRQQRWDGIERWKMKEILNVLPLLIHIALLLFAIGLSVYLWDINVQVALPVVITTSLAALFYIITVSLPLLFAFCPYTTALARFLYPHWIRFTSNTRTKEFIGVIIALVAWISYQTEPLKLVARRYAHSFFDHVLKGGIGIMRVLAAWFSHSLATLNFLVQSFTNSFVGPRSNKFDLEHSVVSEPSNSSLEFSFQEKKLEAYRTIEEWTDTIRGALSTDRLQLDEQITPMDNVTSTMLSWMITNCEDPISVNIALQALAGAHWSLPRRPLWESGAVQLLCHRVNVCIGLLRASAGSMRLPYDPLLDDLSLYSRSHGSLTALVKGEGLEILGAFTTKFNLIDDEKPITGIEDAAIRARLIYDYNPDFILNCLWSGSVPRYDLIAYEFNNFPPQNNHEACNWRWIAQSQCPKQWELVEHVLSGRVANLPATALVAMVNGVTKTYLYNSSQSLVPLLHLVQDLDLELTSNWYPLQAIAIGFVIVALDTGGFSTGREEIDTESPLDIEQSQRLQAIEAYRGLSARELDLYDTQRLLFLGLVSLLGDVSEPESLSPGDIRPIEIALGCIDTVTVGYSEHYSFLPVSPSFSPGQHISQSLSRLIQAASLGLRQESDGDTNHELYLSLRIETLLSNSWLCKAFAEEIIPVLIWDPTITHVDPIWLSRLRFRCINNTLLDIWGDSLRSDMLAFMEQVVEQVESKNSPPALPGLEFLWVASREFLNGWNPYYMPDSTRKNIQALLPILYNSFTVKTTDAGYPANLDELGLANHWLPKIVELCRDDPAGVLDNGLLDSMIRFYEDDNYRDSKPHIEEFPGSVNPTWLEIPTDLERRCELAVEREVEHNAVTSVSAEVDPAIHDEGKYKIEGEYKQDARPDWCLYDGSI